MTPPINIDGDTVEAITIDGDSVGEVTVDGSAVFNAIPDSVVDRGADDATFSASNKGGVRFETSQEWPEIGGEISGSASGVTRAQIYRASDGQLMGETDISGLSGGDAFTIDLSIGLSANEAYHFLLDAEGSGYTRGYIDNPSFPYTSPDGNLEITNGARDATTTAGEPENIRRVGNVGFS